MGGGGSVASSVGTQSFQLFPHTSSRSQSCGRNSTIMYGSSNRSMNSEVSGNTTNCLSLLKFADANTTKSPVNFRVDRFLVNICELSWRMVSASTNSIPSTTAANPGCSVPLVGLIAFSERFFHHMDEFDVDNTIIPRFVPLPKSKCPGRAILLLKTVKYMLSFPGDKVSVKMKLRNLGRAHLGIGVGIKHFRVFAEAFISALADVLGDQFRLEIQRAWSQLLTYFVHELTCESQLQPNQYLSVEDIHDEILKSQQEQRSQREEIHQQIQQQIQQQFNYHSRDQQQQQSQQVSSSQPNCIPIQLTPISELPTPMQTCRSNCFGEHEFADKLNGDQSALYTVSENNYDRSLYTNPAETEDLTAIYFGDSIVMEYANFMLASNETNNLTDIDTNANHYRMRIRGDDEI